MKSSGPEGPGQAVLELVLLAPYLLWARTPTEHGA